MALHFDGATTALPGTDILAPATDSRAIDHAGEITLSLYDSLEACAVAWRTFEEVADHTVFQTFGWLSTWMRTVGGRTRARPAIVIGQAPNGAVLFLMPFAVERHAMVSRLTWLGSDLSDYNAPLLAPGFAAAMCARRFAALWRRIRGSLMADPRFRHDIVSLEKMPDVVGGQRNPFSFLPLAANPSGAHAATLSGDWEAFYAAKRSNSTRKNDKAKRRKLGDLGEVRFLEPSEDSDIRRTLAELFRQKAGQFARMGVVDVFARPGFAEFFAELATDPATRSLVHVSRLDVGDIMAATNLGLVHCGRYYHVLAAYADGETARFGPGAAHLRDLLRTAIERGCREFDFTIGDEPYKREWADSTLALRDLHTGATSAGWILALSVRGFTRAKRTIKQTPALWRAFSRARALGARLTGRRPIAAPEAKPAAED